MSVHPKVREVGQTTDMGKPPGIEQAPNAIMVVTFASNDELYR